MIKRLLVLVILFISGCASKPFQPPTKTYQDWIDGRHSELEIKKALLECGYPSPFADYPIPYDASYTKDNYVKAYKCMLKAGFVNNLKHPSSHICYDSAGLPCNTDIKCQPRPQACDLPWDKIPNRSIKKRLESDYCKHKLYRTYPVCQP